MSRKPSTLLIAAAVLLVALTGCTSESGAAPESYSAATTRALETVATPEWTVDASVVGEPVAADGVVLAYTKASSGSLQVVAWDASTGDQLWADTAVTGAVTPGVMVSANIIDGDGKHFAVYLHPGDDQGWQELVMADLATGAVVALSDSRVWATSRPARCADGEDVCFTGFTRSDNDSVNKSYRLATTGGDIVPDGDLLLPPSSRLLGNSVYSTNARAPEGTEVLGSSTGGETLWERAYIDVFGVGTSSDGGWAWHEDDSTGLLLGVGYASKEADPLAVTRTYDATQRRVVALDPVSGQTVWSIDGADFCDGDVRDAVLADGKRTLCLYKAGITTATGNSGEAGYSNTRTGFDVDLVGVDVATGAVDWTLALGGDRFNGSGVASRFASSTAEQLMLIEGDSVVVNVVTGAVTQSTEESGYACATDRDPLLAAPPGTSETTTFNAGSSYEGCDRKGTITGTFSAGAVRMVGIDTGKGSAVVAVPDGLLGFALEK